MRGLSREENELITRTGPGTPMGEVFRSYWIPVCLSERLPSPGCDPIRIKLLGERLVAFRDTRGRVGLLDEFCPHRQTSLALARNEDCGLRCIYHGWKMDVDGNVLETPPEPPNSAFARSIHHTAYPTREAGGLVWTYMGSPETMSEFPSFDWLSLPRENVWPHHFRQQCNYLQGLEGDVDAAHAGYLHFSPAELDRQQEAPVAYRFLGDPRPGIAVARESWGLKILMAWQQRKEPERRVYWVTPFVPPMYRFLVLGEAAGLDMGLFHAWVPIDDENHWVYSVIYNRAGRMTEDMKDLLDASQGYTWSDPENEYRNREWTGDGYRQYRDEIRQGISYSGIRGVQTQDLAIQHSMGPITDRTKEHLASEDYGVRKVREYLLQLAEDVQNGRPMPATREDLTKIDQRWFYGPTELDLEDVLRNTHWTGDMAAELAR